MQNLRVFGQLKFSFYFPPEISNFYASDRWMITEFRNDGAKTINAKIKDTSTALYEQQPAYKNASELQSYQKMTGYWEPMHLKNALFDQSSEIRMLDDIEEDLILEPWMFDMGKKIKHNNSAENKLVLEDWMLKPSEWLKY
jgi:hypothetical protein